MGDRLGIPGAVGSLPFFSFSPRPTSQLLGSHSPSPSRGVGGWGTDSRCRPGLPPCTPRAPPHSASRKPDDRPSGLGLGLPYRASGNPGGCNSSSPSPTPSPNPTAILAGDRRCSCAPVHTHRYMCTEGVCILFSYSFGGYMPGSGTAESYGTSSFNFLRNLHILFHSGSTNSHSY